MLTPRLPETWDAHQKNARNSCFGCLLKCNISELQSMNMVMYFFIKPLRILKSRQSIKQKWRKNIADFLYTKCYLLNCKTIHTSNQYQSVSANPVALQWCSLWAELASNQRLDKVEPAWRSPSHHSCLFHSFSPNTRHKWMCLCGCLCITSCGTECKPTVLHFLLY